jgi:type IV secretory pathway VirB10-like protein
MKPFTMAILAVGIITLVFYALNPLEPFETLAGQTQTPLDLQTLIAKYRSMPAAEREQLRYEIQQRRNQLGLVNSGFFDQGLHPELKQPPGSDSEKHKEPETAEADAAEAAVNDKMTKQAKAIMAAASEKPVVTLSDVQGLINSQVQSQLANQPIQSCGLSKSYDTSPNYNEILKAAEEQREKMEHKQRIKDKRREIQKKTIDTQQINYRPRQVTAACPSPDPSVWIKRNEIPCWNCKV